MLFHHRSYGGIKWNYFAFGHRKSAGVQTKACILNSTADNHDTPPHSLYFFSAGHTGWYAPLLPKWFCHTIFSSQQVKWEWNFLKELAATSITSFLPKKINYAFSMEIYYSRQQKTHGTWLLLKSSFPWILFMLHESPSFKNSFSRLRLAHCWIYGFVGPGVH